MLSERGQSQKAAYCLISSLRHCDKGETISAETDQWFPGAEEEDRSYRGAQEHSKGNAALPTVDCGGGYMTLCVD